MVQHEDDLRNQRLGYLLTLNGFLFTALGFAWGAHHALSLVVVLALMGILIAVSSFFSMQQSDAAIRELRGRARKTDGGPLAGDEPSRELAELQSIPVAFSSQDIENAMEHPDAKWKDPDGKWKWRRLLQPWYALPVILFLAWIALLVLGCIYLR